MRLNPLALLCLKVAMTLCYFGTAFQYLRFSNTTFSWLFIDFKVEESICTWVVDGMAYTLVVAGFAFWLPRVSWRRLSLAGSVVLAVEAVALSVYPPEWFSTFDIAAHALRIGGAIVFCLWDGSHKIWGLRICAWACSLTFFGHGAKALAEYHLFLDYILAFFADAGFSISLRTGVLLLHIVGTIDIALAHHAMFFHRGRIRWVFRYMMVWGAITAFARVTYGGWPAWHEVVVRAPHALAPLAILLMLKFGLKPSELKSESRSS